MDPRRLTAREAELLRMLLPKAAFPDVDTYRAQVDHALVAGRCPCGCPTIDLTVDESQVPAADFRGDPLLPIEAEASEGEHFVQLILFAPDGWLKSLELVYYTSEPPIEFPPPSEWRLMNRN